MKICIVGGGSAGWITLSYLAATTDIELTIVHSNEVDPIGVGESTTPTIKYVADRIGVDEHQWMKDAKATFKYGVEFNDFNKIGSRWLHSFDDMLPHQCFHRPITENGKELHSKDLTSVEYFFKKHGKDAELFNRTHGPQEHLLQHKLSPFDKNHNSNISQYPGYSYHINAFQFGESLRKHTDKNRYTEIVEKITEVNVSENNISSLVTETGKVLEADLFVDCTGFHKLLIGKLSQWSHYKDLLNDSAVWGQIKNTYSDKPVTGVHAQESGWIWEIPTYDQIGTGYVYSSKHCDEDTAWNTIENFWANKGYKFERFKSTKFDAGRQNNVSIGNVISNGLSQSFIEPLEATSIMVTCVTAKSLEEIYNKKKIWNTKQTEIHNKVMTKFIDHTKKFVHFHYRLSERDDTPYWREVANDSTAVQEICDYIDVLSKGQWLSKGETLLNQWNWSSLLLGFDKPYVNKLPDITDDQLENYEHYTKILIENYKHIVRNNIKIKDYLENIHR